MSGRRAMRFRFVRGFFVGVQTQEPPTNEVWQAHCVEVKRLRYETRGVLVYTEGGGPDSSQRQMLRRALGELQAPPTAILAASPIVRGIITGLNWFFRDSRIVAFGPSDVKGALDYLARGGELPRDDLVNALAALADELGMRLPFSPKP